MSAGNVKESQELEAPLLKDGWMRKKSSRVNVWGDRYFVLRGSTLYYYLKSTDLVCITNFPCNCVSDHHTDFVLLITLTLFIYLF